MGAELKNPCGSRVQGGGGSVLLSLSFFPVAFISATAFYGRHCAIERNWQIQSFNGNWQTQSFSGRFQVRRRLVQGQNWHFPRIFHARRFWGFQFHPHYQPFSLALLCLFLSLKSMGMEKKGLPKMQQSKYEDASKGESNESECALGLKNESED